MVGRDLTHRFPPKTNKPGETILEVKNLTGAYQPSVIDASFKLRKGEILGVAGLVGSRRTELIETIFGIAHKSSGEILLHGKPVNNKDSRAAIKNGFALLTEERRATGIFGGLDIKFNATIANIVLHGKPVNNKDSRAAIKNGFALLTEERRATGIFGGLDIKFNATIANIDNYSKFGVLDNKKMTEDTKWTIDSMKVKTPTQKTAIRSLSGGNQQKVIIGRWLLTNPEILLLDEPTRGIDVGAKYEIYQLIIDLANKGKGVIMVSSEMPELLGICDRILVMSNGKVAGIEDTDKLDQEKIMTLAAKYI